METTVLYPQVQPSLECITHNEEQQQQDTSRLCTPNPNVKPSTSISNKLYYRSLDSISPTPKRPKLRAIHSSDTSRFPTLERLENTMVSSKNSKITVEPAAFADNSSSYNMTKGSQVSKKKKTKDSHLSPMLISSFIKKDRHKERTFIHWFH